MSTNSENKQVVDTALIIEHVLNVKSIEFKMLYDLFVIFDNFYNTFSRHIKIDEEKSIYYNGNTIKSSVML